MRDERPDREPDLQRLVEEHVDMRSHAVRISAHLDRAEWQAAVQTFDALKSLFHRHEAFERKVVAS
jgi:hypothetical protein